MPLMLLILRKSNDSDKDTDNKQQAKACSSMSCTLFAFMGVHGCYVFSMGFFISYLRHVCDTSYLAIRYNLD